MSNNKKKKKKKVCEDFNTQKPPYPLFIYYALKIHISNHNELALNDNRIL